MRKCYCDHCGKEINDKDDYTDYDIEFEAQWYPCDLCTECLHTLVDDIKKTIVAYINKKR